MALKSYTACAEPESQPLWKARNAYSHSISKVNQLTAEEITLYASTIRRAADKGADDLALSLAKKSIELAPASILLRVVLANLYIKAQRCSLALPHLKHAHDLINPQTDDTDDIRHRVMIASLLNFCSKATENEASISFKGQRSASLLDRPGESVVPIDQGSLFDRYCHALGSLCSHEGKVDLDDGDRGGMSIWLHVETASKIRAFDVWKPTLRTHIFRRLNSKPSFGLHGATIQLVMNRLIDRKRRFGASLSAQSIAAQQGAKKPKLAREAWRVDVTMRYLMTKQ